MDYIQRTTIQINELNTRIDKTQKRLAQKREDSAWPQDEQQVKVELSQRLQQMQEEKSLLESRIANYSQVQPIV